MLGLALVAPLEDDWREALDAVASANGWPTSVAVGDLAKRVAGLSAAYNDPTRARAAMRDAGAARLAFGFARDVPKGAAAVRELVATSTLSLDLTLRALRVLDVGAGLGAMTWGVARALEASGTDGILDATWTDTDAKALETGVAIARLRAGRGRVQIRPRTLVTSTSLDGLEGPDRFDLVLVGHLLSELDVGVSEEARAERHAAMLHALLEQRLETSGSLVVVEPALRDRTRHLHRVRDRLVRRGATIFAPCLHASECPALARDSDWCHEDLPIDLPSWLVPVARHAGLRREGLTFSYAVFRRDGTTLADRVHRSPTASSLRAVSERIDTKGKKEAYLCGEFARGDLRIAARAKATRLDRDAQAGNAGWDRLRRGDLAVVEPPLDLERPRVESSTSVSIASDDVETR
jgi:ribosomal protein RSM22 (predicted rRNA methylase)